MELMEDEAFPCFRQCMLRVAGCTQPFGSDSRSFCCIAQLFVLSVVQLHGRLRSVATCSVNIHQYPSVEYRQFGVVIEWQIIFIQLIAGGADHFHRSVALDSLFLQNVPNPMSVNRRYLLFHSSDRPYSAEYVWPILPDICSSRGLRCSICVRSRTRGLTLPVCHRYPSRGR